MYIFNNIHDRDYKSEYPEETKVIFDISEKQIGNAKNSDWSSLTSGDIACVVTSSRKISTFFKVTEIKGLGDSHPTDGETFILRGEVVAKLPKEELEKNIDLVSMFIRNENTNDMVDRPFEYLGNLLLLIIGGNDTTRNSLTGGVWAMHNNPKAFELLKSDLSLIPNMVPEIIRWQTPLAHMRRIATQDVELGGKLIKKGDKVVMWYVSGNRDEDVISTPNDLVIDRKNARQHLSFGFGIHRCMGNRLAEMQIRVTWEEIMKRFSKLEVVKDPVYVKSNFVKGYEELMVKVTRK